MTWYISFTWVVSELGQHAPHMAGTSSVAVLLMTDHVREVLHSPFNESLGEVVRFPYKRFGLIQPIEPSVELRPWEEGQSVSHTPCSAYVLVFRK